MHRPNGGVFSSRAFAGAENEPLAVVEFTESRSNARGTHEHEHRPWFAQRCRHWRTGALVAQAAKQVKIRARSVRSHARPNPSVEGTSSSGLRPPPAAPHVKR